MFLYFPRCQSFFFTLYSPTQPNTHALSLFICQSVQGKGHWVVDLHEEVRSQQTRKRLSHNFTWSLVKKTLSLSHYTHKQISCKNIISKLCFVIVQHRASTCTSCFSYQNLLHKINFTKRQKNGWKIVSFTHIHCYKLLQKTKRVFCLMFQLFFLRNEQI